MAKTETDRKPLASPINLCVGCITALIYIVLIFIICRNLWDVSLQTLWYDEAGQFFMSKGLCHYSDPMASPGGLKDVLYYNARYNMDPGGFSILLYFWTMISNDVVWLRFLPFILYLAAILFTCLTAWEITGNKTFSLICGLSIFTVWGGTAAYILRGYSMELFGLAFGLWSIFHLRKNPKLRNYLIYSIILSFLITARYTMMVFGGIFAAFVVYQILFSQFTIRRKIYVLLCYCLPLLITVVWVYLIMTRLQNSGFEPLSYIRYIPSIGILPICFFLSSVLLIISYYWQKSEIKELILIFIGCNLTFFILGKLEMLPWDFSGNKGAPFGWLWMLTLLIGCYGFMCDRWIPRKWINVPAILGVVLAMCVAQKYIYINSTNADNLDNSLESLSKIDMSKIDKIYASERANCVVRYLYEYGPLKGRRVADGYPSKFVLQTGGIHCIDPTHQINHSTTVKNHNLMLNLPKGSYIISDYLYTDDFIKNPDFANITGSIFVKIK